MRLSTATTPRVIACAEDLPQFVGLPRGCQNELEALLRDHGVSVEVEDQRVGGERLALQAAADTLCARDIGVFVAPPGVGKTVVGDHLVAAPIERLRYVSTVRRESEGCAANSALVDPATGCPRATAVMSSS